MDRLPGHHATFVLVLLVNMVEHQHPWVASPQHPDLPSRSRQIGSFAPAPVRRWKEVWAGQYI